EAGSWKQAEAFAKQQKIPLNKPINELSEQQINLMLYGSEVAELTYEPSEADAYTYLNADGFEGVLNMMMRWFTESTSDYIREWAEKFMVLDNCPECGGSRLRKESLWFKVAGKNIAYYSALPLGELFTEFNDLEQKLDSKQKVIAKDILTEIKDRLSFLLDVGLHYLSLNRPSRSLSGGESQRIRLATQIGSQLVGIT